MWDALVELNMVSQYQESVSKGLGMRMFQNFCLTKDDLINKWMMMLFEEKPKTFHRSAKDIHCIGFKFDLFYQIKINLYLNI